MRDDNGTRDYSDLSDLDLAINAANEIVEGGGEDYWASLRESNPRLASEAEIIKRLGKQFKKTEAELAEALALIHGSHSG